MVAIIGIFSGCNGRPHAVLSGSDGRPHAVPEAYSKASGDLVKFFIDKAKAYGGRVNSTNTLPKVDAVWWHLSDPNGFQVVTEKTNLVPFVRALEEAYGKTVPITNNFQVLYKVTDIGVAISYDPNLDTNYIHFICLKPIRF